MEENNIEKYEELEYKTWKDRLLSALNGFFIGLAIIVPGVSGSTISIIFRLYDKMMYALSHLFKKFKTCVLFLLPLLIGGIIGFVGGFFTVQAVIDKYMFICVSLFAGLMLGGASEVQKEIKSDGERKRGWKEYLLLAIGLILPISLSLIFIGLGGKVSLESSFSQSEFPFYLYIVSLLLGVAVSLTQIVPGLSATTLLMCFGAFTPIVDSVSITVWKSNPMWILIYLLLAVGFVVGILLFSKAVNYFIEKYRFSSFHLLTGLAYGSVISIFYNTETIGIYQSWMEGAGNIGRDLGVGIPLFVVGFALSFCLVYFGNKYFSKKKEK